MKIACVLAVVLALAATVAAQQAQIKLNNAKDKWTWELVSDKATSLLTSEPFDDKKSCARSAVALLVNGGDKKRCTAGVGVANSKGVTIGATRSGEEDVESEKQKVRVAAGKKIDCGEVHNAITSIVHNFVKTHADGQAIGNTKLKIEVKQSEKDKQFFFHVRAGNGEIVLRSEQYKEKDSALKGLESVLLNGGVKSAYEVNSEGGKSSFHLKALNHQIIGASETYDSEANAERGRAGVQKKVRTMLSTIADPDAQEQPEQQQQPKKKEQQPKNKEQQQKQKKEQQQKKKKPEQVQQALPPNAVPTGKGQAVQADVQGPGQQPLPPAAKGKQQQLDDNDVAEDDSDEDVDDDDDDSDI